MSSGRIAKFDADYLFDLCVDVFTLKLERSKKGKSKEYMAGLLKKYGSKEKAEKRYRDKAQIVASEVRSVLKALDAKGKLPSKARAK